MKTLRQSPKHFSPHKISIWDFKTIVERGRAEIDEIPKLSFPFQIQSQNGKRWYYSLQQNAYFNTYT